jgi:hypothetical protein
MKLFPRKTSEKRAYIQGWNAALEAAALVAAWGKYEGFKLSAHLRSLKLDEKSDT